MELSAFNTLSAEAAADVVRPCADVGDWVAAVVAGRPYDELDDLLALADSEARAWTPAEVDGALAHHPRIGERLAGVGAEQDLSRSEQATIAGRDGDVDAAIAAGNAAYEERFGRVFLIRAAGRSAPEILQHLTTRLEHDDVAELGIVADELRQIALLRLEGTFA
ncbi:2-oxo-4-hydroxy-4-carboxy-5-ureidoimidazoline decarboxylase [Aeromicrobium alkaliterrae]|uniref:2-oxo-4-hydroxy-4-carboxy-5-ureidoimidazoline decarboxylase n=1 Tax=Aeromicrobium alkaliterrae TaxID=302168 RepID=A0ABN2JX89_9ACTN